MKNVFIHLLVVVFVLAVTRVSYSNANDWIWKLFRHGKPTTARPRRTRPTTKQPTTLPKLPSLNEIPHEELKKIMIASQNMSSLYKYLGISQSMSMKIREQTKPPPPPDPKVQGQSYSEDDGCACAPRLTRSFIPNPTWYLGTFIPSNCLVTFQCGGGCVVSDRQECRAVESEVKTSYKLYYYMPFTKIPYEIRSFNISYHMRCGCVCKTRTCPPRMFLNQDICLCTCKQEYSPEVLNCRRPFEYDSDKCACICKEKYCPRGKRFDRHTCMCRCPRGMVDIGQGKCKSISMSLNKGK